MMLINPLALLLALAVTNVALIDTTELSLIRGDRLSVMAIENATVDLATLTVADSDHGDCEFSGVVPGVWFTGVSLVTSNTTRPSASLEPIAFITSERILIFLNSTAAPASTTTHSQLEASWESVRSLD